MQKPLSYNKEPLFDETLLAILILFMYCISELQILYLDLLKESIGCISNDPWHCWDCLEHERKNWLLVSS